MKIKELSLKNYRTYHNDQFQFDDHLNLLIGSNAQGKTNLIEAIYLLSHSKSFRSKNHRDLIQFESDFSYIKGNVWIGGHQKILELVLFQKGKKAKINGMICKKSSDFVGVFNVVVFSPDDLMIVKGEPRLRRNFLDIELSKLSHIYLSYYNQYMHYLKERNMALKKGNIDLTYLEVLTTQLVSQAIEVAKRRYTFISKLNKYCEAIYAKLTHGKEQLKISYESMISLDLQTALKQYKDVTTKDLRYQTTTIGIHKDDLKMSINGLDAKQYASQGQQRSIVLALKIGLVEFIYHELGEYPVLLLDDVLSELDDSRQEMLVEMLSDEMQIFITTTSVDSLKYDILNKAKKFQISKERKSSV